MSTATRFENNLWLRIAAFLLGIIVLIWLSIEDENTLGVVLISGAICVWGGLSFLVKHLAGGIQVILRYSLVGVGVGLAIAPLGILLMALKSGLHGHSAPDFSILQMQAVLMRTPYYALSGSLIGLGAGLWRSVSEVPEAQQG